MDNNYKDSGFVNAKEEQVYNQDMGAKKAKYTVVVYAYASFEVEADSPEEANTLALEDGSYFDLVEAIDQDPRIKEMSWSWSDAMGSEVYNEKGETVLCDW
jgi:hypothetical protein